MRVVLVLLLLLGAIHPGHAANHPTISGRIVGISDGDTLVMLTAHNHTVKLRLFGVDAPEHGQPYGAKARAALSALTFGKEGRAVVVDTDDYSRAVAWLVVGETGVNAELVKQGAAWVYRRYTKDARLMKLEAHARRDRRGLWALSHGQRVPPWVWRKQHPR